MFNQVPPALPPGFAPHDLPPRPASAFGPNNVPPRYTSTPLSQHAPTFEPRAQSGGVNSSSASPNSRRRADSDSPGDLSTARPPIPAPAPVDIPTRYAQLQKQYKAVTSELAALAHEIPEDSFIYREIANALRNYPEDTLPALSQVKYHFWQLDHEIKKFFVNLEKHKDNFEKYKAYVEKYKDNEELRLRCMGHRDEARESNKALNYMGLSLKIVPSVFGSFPPKELPILDSYDTVTRLTQAQWIQFFRFYYTGLHDIPDDLLNTLPRDSFIKAISAAIGIDWAWNEGWRWRP